MALNLVKLLNWVYFLKTKIDCKKLYFVPSTGIELYFEKEIVLIHSNNYIIFIGKTTIKNGTPDKICK